jgi:RimJ/RimL family protein N-acetyltransferase
MERMKFGRYSLCVCSSEDVPEVARIIEELFSDPITKRFFVLGDEYSTPPSFAQSMADVNEQHRGIDCIVRDNDQNNIGLLTCELDRKWQNNVYWSIGVTIHPSYRNRGYATEILKDICMVLAQERFDDALLDISEDDVYMERAAKSAGFTKIEYRQNGYRMGRIDLAHPEIGMHNIWCRKVHELCERDTLCNEALSLARNREYLTAINKYQLALTKAVPQYSGWTDAQIYSNLGMCYSSSRRYHEAFRCLKKAQDLGLNNPSIQQELLWLRNNVGLG